MARIVNLGKTAIIEFSSSEINRLHNLTVDNTITEQDRHLSRVFDVVNEALNYKLFSLTSHSDTPPVTKSNSINDDVQTGF